ncbi:MAG: hypothetical protein FVQ83_13640 [Chloroflexi bacterium]|nr:hypothetical protein [Chloroflexota bacterium]
MVTRKMNIRVKFSVFLSVCLLQFLACSIPRDVSDTVETSLAVTRTVQVGQAPVSNTPLGEAPAQNLPTPTITLTPIFTSTPTLGIPMVIVSVDTNCRTGPGQVYDWVGDLLVGETSEVVGRLADNSYWHIRNLDRPGELCYLWGRYATVSGDSNRLPVRTPPPPPTPTLIPTPAVDFSLTYDQRIFCSGDWALFFTVENTGGVILESIEFEIVDQGTNYTTSFATSQFMSSANCTPGALENLSPGDTGYFGRGPWNLPSGLTITTATLCTEDFPPPLGICVTRQITFTP